MTTASDIDLIENAAAIIDGNALALRISSTIPPFHLDWRGEDGDKAEYDNMKQTIAGLYALVDRMRERP